jgi:phage baseplate assembly protein W
MANLKHIYADLDLTFNKLPVTGDVAMSYDDKSVIRSVVSLLLTNFYERPFNPDLGSNLNKILFEPVTPLTGNMLSEEISNVIKNYEHRVLIDNILVSPDEDNNRYGIELRIQGSQTFHSRSHRDWRCDNTISEQESPADNGREEQELVVASDEGIERKDAAFAVVVGSEGKDDVLEGGLDGKGPEDTAKCAQDDVVIDQAVADDS